MKAGKLPGVVENRSVFMYTGARGMDPAQAACGAGADGRMMVLAADQAGIFGREQTRALRIGALFDRVCGKLAAQGAGGEVFTAALSLPPNTQEAEIKKLAAAVAQAAQEREITAYSVQMQVRYEAEDGKGTVQMTVTGAGSVRAAQESNTVCETPESAFHPHGKSVVMAGYAALEATAVFISEKQEFLLRRLAAGYLAQGLEKSSNTDLRAAAHLARKMGALIKTAGEGGIFAALWELGEYLDCGMDLNPYDILLLQETIEVCELLDVSPYQLSSGGCLLAVTDNADALLAAYDAAGIAAAKIGTLKEGRDRVLHNGPEERFLEPFRAEELYRVLHECGQNK